MGIYYQIFLEGKADGAWRCLDPFMKAEDGQFRHACIMEGKSHVGTMLNDIECQSGIPDDVSGEVRDALPRKFVFGEKTTREVDPSRVMWFDAGDICVDPSRFEQDTYVERESLEQFEPGETDETRYWLAHEEHDSSPPDKKRGYPYRCLSDPWSSYASKCRLKALANDLAVLYRDNVLLLEPGYPQLEAMRCIVILD